MTIRWRRLLKILIPAVFLMQLPVLLNWLFFREPLYVICVREYADGRIEDDSNDGCYDESKPKPTVVLRAKEDARKQDN